ncbi:MAG: NUDIX domain-containing protein [Candidatus Paceibacterota bacterium]
MKNDHKKSSDFQPLENEANFPPSVDKEVVGGMHIAPECITRKNNQFVMVEWPNGLPRHDSERTVRFPHGLMKFGETIEACAKRLVKKQIGAKLKSSRILYLDSYVDDNNHWHLEPWVLVELSGDFNLPKEAEKVHYFKNEKDLPEDSLWSREEFKSLIIDYF